MRNSDNNEAKASLDSNLNSYCSKSVYTKLITEIKPKWILSKAIHQIMIKQILAVRSKSATVISKFFQGFKTRKAIQDKAMLNTIINQRTASAMFIQQNYRRHFNHKMYHNLYMKVKDCYSIFPSISNTEHPLIMRIFLPTQCKLVKVAYCPLRKSYVVDIPKNKVTKTRQLKVNYLINNLVIIDSTQLTKYYNDQYVNIIDFDAIQKKEDIRKGIIFEAIVELGKRKWSNIESRTTQEDELHFDDCDNEKEQEQEQKEAHKSTEEEDINSKRRMNGMKTVQFASLTIDFKHIRTERKFLTVKSDISRVKSILKPCMSTSSSGRCLNTKKVCFGNVQFSF